MKRRTRLAAIVIAPALLGMLLVFLFPAAWALGLARATDSRLDYQGASGSIWDGRVTGLHWRGLALGEVDWRLDDVLGPRTLSWRATGTGIDYHLVAGLQTRGLRLNAVYQAHGELPAGWMNAGTAATLLRLRGRIAVDVEHVQLSEDSLPVEAQGRLTWQDAGLAGLVRLDLGEIDIVFNPQANGSRFDIATQQPADMAVEGQGQWSEARYAVTLLLAAAAGKQAVLDRLEALGTRQPDGRLKLYFEGEITRRAP